MSYIDRLNAFHRGLDSSPLSAPAQLMYFHLLEVFNRAGWPEWVRVDHLRMMSLLQTKSKHTVIRGRDELVRRGWLEYRRGQKGQPSRYRLTDVPPAPYAAPYPAPYPAPQCAPIIREREEKEESAAAAAPAPADSEFAALIQAARDLGLPVERSDQALILRLRDEYGYPWLKEALARVQYRNRNWGVVDGILRSWKKKGGIDHDGPEGTRRPSSSGASAGTGNDPGHEGAAGGSKKESPALPEVFL